MRKKLNWVKGIAAALALAVSVTAAEPAQALAAQKMTVGVASPKKNIKVSGRKIYMHAKKPVTLKVMYKGKNVAKKATYKVSGKAVRVKNGKITVRKNGKATVSVKYKNMNQKYNVVVSGHNWKAHKATKTVKHCANICNCGVNLDELWEKKDCSVCNSAARDGWCICKEGEHSMNHIRNGEPDNYTQQVTYETVTYTDYYTFACGAKKAN